MNISNRSRLAVEALLDLAQRAEPHPLPLISRRLRVSVSYLEGLFAQLRRKGLVHGTCGPRWRLPPGARPPAISVRDVRAALNIFERAERSMASRLSSVTLLDLIVQHRRHADVLETAA